MPSFSPLNYILKRKQNNEDGEVEEEDKNNYKRIFIVLKNLARKTTKLYKLIKKFIL